MSIFIANILAKFGVYNKIPAFYQFLALLPNLINLTGRFVLT